MRQGECHGVLSLNTSISQPIPTLGRKTNNNNNLLVMLTQSTQTDLMGEMQGQKQWDLEVDECTEACLGEAHTVNRDRAPYFLL